MSFFAELKRRNVVRVGIAYAVMGWVLLQGADFALDLIDAPNWVIQSLVIVVVLGLPIALAISWAFEVTPEGIKREAEVDRSQSITSETSGKLDRLIVVFLALAVVGLLAERFWSGNRSTSQPGPSAQTEMAQITDDATNASLGAAAEPSIAVLPFTTRSANEDDQFFSDGMHDDLLTQLAKIGSLKVLSRTSVMEYRDTTKNLRQIGQELGAANILEGAVQRSGQQVRINVQLIDAQTDEHLWAETYDRALSATNLFSIQTEIALAIAAALETTLSPEESQAIERQLTDNLEALEAYRRARLMTRSLQNSSNRLDDSELELRRALELDPDFAAAWAQLARNYLQKWWLLDRNPQYLAEAKTALDQGRAIDPDLPELDIAEGYYHYWGFLDYSRALQVLEPALASFPNDPELYEVIAYVHRRAGNFDKAIDNLESALELAPRDLDVLFAIGETQVPRRKMDQARNALDRMKEIDPVEPSTYWLEAWLLSIDGNWSEAARLYRLAGSGGSFFQDLELQALINLGDLDAALSVAETAQQLAGRDLQFADLMRGLTYVAFDQPEQARPLLQQAASYISERAQNDPDNFGDVVAGCRAYGGLNNATATEQWCQRALDQIPNDAYDLSRNLWLISQGLAMAGLVDQALDVLEKSREQEARISTTELLSDPLLKDLNGHPRWQALFDDLDNGP